MPFKHTGTLLLTLDCRIAFASTYFCDLVGIEHNKVAGLSWFKFVFPEDMDGARNLLQAAKLPHVDPLRFRLRRLDGTEVWTDIQAANVKAPGRRIYAITATVTAVNGNLGGGRLWMRVTTFSVEKPMGTLCGSVLRRRSVERCKRWCKTQPQ